MNAEVALQFLRDHQPLPPTSRIDGSLLRRFDEICRYFAVHLDSRSVPLILNALGDGDGHGVYQLVEETVLAYPESVVIPALQQGLQSPFASVRYWSAQIAANYCREELIEPLGQVLDRGSLDECLAAVTALELIGSPDADRRLRAALQSCVDERVRAAIRDALAR